MKFADHYKLLLEKDHRKKITKMGMPANVANYLHTFDDKYSLWFADKINKMPAYKHYTQDHQKLMFVHNLETNMTSILDWIRNTPNILIKEYDWQSALDAAREYHDNIEITNISRETNTIMKEYENGFYWVDLESSYDSCEESSMGHCANTNKADTLYSLRKYNNATRNVESFITIAASPDSNTFYQCKGKRNSKPKEEYYEYIVDILIQNDIYTFKSEYDTGSDFTNKELIEYLNNKELNKEEEAFLEKVNESSITVEDFEKILKEYSNYFKYYDMCIYEGEETDLYVYYNFYLEIKKEDTDLPISCLDLENSAAKKYFRKVIPIWVNDLEVETLEDGGVAIKGTFEDDTYYNLDETGLDAFKSQCEYLKRENEQFDYEEFIKDDLKTICILDDCLESHMINLKQYVKNHLHDFYEIDKPDDPISFNIVTRPSLFFDVSLTHNSIIRKSHHSNSIHLPKTIANFERLNQKSEIEESVSIDAWLLSAFFESIISKILQNDNDHLRIVYDESKKLITLSMHYTSDEEEEFDEKSYYKELEYLQMIKAKYSTITNKFQKYMKQIVVPAVQDTLPIDKNDFRLNSSSLKDRCNLFFKNTYITLLDDCEMPSDADLNRYIELNHLTGSYKPLDKKKVIKWLQDNVSKEQIEFDSFKDFFNDKNI